MLKQRGEENSREQRRGKERAQENKIKAHFQNKKYEEGSPAPEEELGALPLLYIPIIVRMTHLGSERSTRKRVGAIATSFLVVLSVHDALHIAMYI